MSMHRRSVTARTRTIATIAATAALALAAASASGARTTDATAAPNCRTAGLVLWIDTRGDAGAGSVFHILKFTNQSGHPCVLTGYPGVSAVDLRGRRLGSAASRNPSAVHAVSLTSGATASAQLRIAQAANFPASACNLAPAARLRIYPPNQTASKVVPDPVGCINSAAYEKPSICSGIVFVHPTPSGRGLAEVVRVAPTMPWRGSSGGLCSRRPQTA
ncbi:MAG: DUF4232 domain-containing protein [Gaiellaceae bacterium]